jgi:alanine-synthesizing transaminase
MVSLKKELSKTYRERYGVHTDPAREIIITIGSKEGISHLCLAVCGPGDLVLVPSPYFPIHVYAPIIAGADVETFPLCSEEEMLRAISDRYTSPIKPPKVLILNYPHNPTGATVTRSFFSEIVRLARKFGFIVVHDFAYSRLVYDGKSAPSFLEVPGASEVGVEFGSFSKTFNMAGWRIGYCAGNEHLVSALKRIKGYFDYGIFSAIQVAGITALRHCEADTRHQVCVYQERRDMLCDGLEKMGWDTPKPSGGMFVWSRIPDALLKGQDTLGFSLKLLNEDRKSTRLNSSHNSESRMPSSA